MHVQARTTVLVLDSPPSVDGQTAEAVHAAPDYDLRFVDDATLFDYLRAASAEANGANRPGVILVHVDEAPAARLAALRRLRTDPDLCTIPVVAMCSDDDDDGDDDIANLYITKPASFEGLVDVVSTLGRYWLKSA